MIPVAKPDLTEAEVEAAARIIRSGWLIQGPAVAEFEEGLKKFTGAKSVFCVSSCTTGLQLAIEALGIGPGDEVIVPSLSFIATANSVVHARATPVFADIRLEDHNLDVSSVRAAISPRTKAIMAVHQIGVPADIEALSKLARERGLALIEDAACAIGATYKGKPIGSHSDLVVFSFHPRKILTTGEGGAVVYNGSDPKIAQYIEMARRHGQGESVIDRHHASKVSIERYPLIGYNYRMTDMQAAIGIVQLKRLPEMLARRRERAEQYLKAFAACPALRLPKDPAGCVSTFQSFMIGLNPSARVTVLELMQRLLDEGIATRRGVMASHVEDCYKARPETTPVALPNTERAVRENIILPLYSTMTGDECKRVIDAVLRYV